MKTRNKLGVLIISNILAIFFWLAMIFNFDSLGGLSLNRDFLIPFYLLAIGFLIYSTFYSFKLIGFRQEIFERQKLKLSIMGLISTFTNVISSVIYLVIINDINSNKISLLKKDKKEDIKNIYAKLGLLLLIFVTILAMNFIDLTGYVRTIIYGILAIATLLFSDRLRAKNLFSASNWYYVASMLLVIICYLSFGYLELFGKWFSLFGEGKLIFISSIFALTAVLLLASYLKYEKDALLFAFYTVLVLFAINFLKYLSLNVEEILAIITPIFLFMTFFAKKKNTSPVLLSFSNVLVLSFAAIFFMVLFIMENKLAVYSLSIIFIAFLYIFVKRNMNSYLRPFLGIISYCLFFPSLIVMRVSAGGLAFATTLFAVVTYFLSYMYKDDEVRLGAIVTTNALIFLSFIVAITSDFLSPILVAIIAILLGTLISIIDEDNTTSAKLELYLTPFKIAMLAYGMALLLNFSSTNAWQYFISLNLLANVIIYLFVKTKSLKKIYRQTAIISVILAVLSLASFTSLTATIVTIAALLVYYAELNWCKKETRNYRVFVFVLMLIGIYITMANIDSYVNYYGGTHYYFANIMTIILYLFIGFFHYKDKEKASLALVLAVVPFFALIDAIINPAFMKVAHSLIVVYLTLIACRFTPHGIIKDFIRYFGFSAALLFVLFDTSFITLIYILILGVVLLKKALRKNDSVYFKISLVALMFTLVYRLSLFLFEGPIKYYLLILVLLLIILLASKQLSHDKKINKK